MNIDKIIEIEKSAQREYVFSKNKRYRLHIESVHNRKGVYFLYYFQKKNPFWAVFSPEWEDVEQITILAKNDCSLEDYHNQVMKLTVFLLKYRFLEEIDLKELD